MAARKIFTTAAEKIKGPRECGHAERREERERERERVLDTKSDVYSDEATSLTAFMYHRIFFSPTLHHVIYVGCFILFIIYNISL